MTAVITDQGSSDNTDFILSKHAFSRMAQTTDAAASLLALGVVDIDLNIHKKNSHHHITHFASIFAFFFT